MIKKKTFIVLVCMSLLLISCNLLDIIMYGNNENWEEEEEDYYEEYETDPPPAPVPSVSIPSYSSSDTIADDAYYVGQTSCSDTGPGDEESPFCSFETALNQLVPGDMLVIQPGIYTEPLIIEGVSGNPDAPIIIRGESRNAVIFDGGCQDFPCNEDDVNADENWDGMVIVTDGDYVTLSYITVRNNIGMGILVEGGKYTTVTNTLIDSMGNGGIIVGEDPISPQIIGNEVTRTDLGWLDGSGSFYEGDHEAISIIRAAGFVVANNYLHDVFEEGIVIKESSSDGDVYDNLVLRACAVGIYIDEAEDVRIFNNQIPDAGYFLTDGGKKRPCSDFFVLDDEVLSDYYGNGIQLSVGDLGELSQGLLSNIEVYQNLVWGCHLNGLESWDELRASGTGLGQITDVSIYNNVFYNCGVDDVGAGIRLEDIDDVEVINNIIALNSEEAITGNSIERSKISHNLFYFSEDWQKPVGDNYVLGDPLFTNPDNGDFHLEANSPAIDAGTDMGLPTVDAPDIGAFEYGNP